MAQRTQSKVASDAIGHGRHGSGAVCASACTAHRIEAGAGVEELGERRREERKGRKGRIGKERKGKEEKGKMKRKGKWFSAQAKTNETKL